MIDTSSIPRPMSMSIRPKYNKPQLKISPVFILIYNTISMPNVNINWPKNTQKDAMINVQYIPYLFVIHGDINALKTAAKNANCVWFIFNSFSIVVSNVDTINKHYILVIIM